MFFAQGVRACGGLASASFCPQFHPRRIVTGRRGRGGAGDDERPKRRSLVCSRVRRYAPTTAGCSLVGARAGTFGARARAQNYRPPTFSGAVRAIRRWERIDEMLAERTAVRRRYTETDPRFCHVLASRRRRGGDRVPRAGRADTTCFRSTTATCARRAGRAQGGDRRRRSHLTPLAGSSARNADPGRVPRSARVFEARPSRWAFPYEAFSGRRISNAVAQGPLDKKTLWSSHKTTAPWCFTNETGKSKGRRAGARTSWDAGSPSLPTTGLPGASTEEMPASRGFRRLTLPALRDEEGV